MPAETAARSPTRMSDRPSLTERDFARIAAVAKTSFGLQLEPAKKSMIESRLGKRLMACDCASFAAYCDLLEGGTRAEIENFISAITTNVTQFYREVHHFEQLERDILPALVTRARSGGRVRLWSAGCSSGPEPYSLAGSLLKLCPEAGTLDIRILATDLDKSVLAQAKSGAYPADQCEVPAPEYGKRLFEPGGAAKGVQTIRKDVAALVTFRPLNLIAAWPMSGRFDVVMCRNVVIYFDKPTQHDLWRRFADILTPEGIMCIGHSERVSGPALERFVSAGTTSYRLRTASAAGPTSTRGPSCR